MHVSHTLLTKASPEKIWKIWTDVKNWKNWDFGLRDALLKGPFQQNGQGMIQPDKGPRSGFRITSCSPNFSYTVTTRLPFAELHIHRYLGYHNSKTTFTHEIWLEGPLSGVWWSLIGRRYMEQLPSTMQKVKEMAETEGVLEMA